MLQEGLTLWDLFLLINNALYQILLASGPGNSCLLERSCLVSNGFQGRGLSKTVVWGSTGPSSWNPACSTYSALWLLSSIFFLWLIKFTIVAMSSDIFFSCLFSFARVDWVASRWYIIQGVTSWSRINSMSVALGTLCFLRCLQTQYGRRSRQPTVTAASLMWICKSLERGTSMRSSKKENLLPSADLAYSSNTICVWQQLWSTWRPVVTHFMKVSMQADFRNRG